MSKIAFTPNASGTGTFSIASPGTDTDRTLTLPDATGTVVLADATQTLTNKTIQGGAITLGTAVASTSGTAIDFTGIPSWAKRVTVLLNGVSFSGSAHILVQAGVSSIQTTGYVSSGAYAGASSTLGTTSSAGFVVYSGATVNVIYATVQINLLTGSTWLSTHSGAILQSSTTPFLISGGGNVTLGGTLDRVRITSTNGTDTFDAGTINISYEG
jgi:hypothetical protein